MKISFQRKKPRAFAVVAALVAVIVLTLLAGAFAYSMKVETKLASNSNHDEQMLWLGRAGVQRACWVLQNEAKLPFTALNQIWAGGPGAGPETNGPLAGLDLTKPYAVGLSASGGPDPVGTVTLKIIDLDRKININTAPPQLLQQVFTSMGVNANDISVISDSIQDWIDPDDSTHPAGAESDYYQGQNPPYFAKNAPMDDISELLLVKGVTPGMYDGRGAASEPESPFGKHKLGFNNSASSQEPDYPFHFVDIFTAFSGGKINVNTADANVLALIPGMDTDSVQSILKFRAGPDGAENSDTATPFQNPGQVASAGINAQAAAQIQNFITTRSTTFEVHVTATIGDQSREFIAVVFINGQTAQVVRFYWE